MRFSRVCASRTTTIVQTIGSFSALDPGFLNGIGAERWLQRIEVEPAAVGGDRLQGDEAVCARSRDLGDIRGCD